MDPAAISLLDALPWIIASLAVAAKASWQIGVNVVIFLFLLLMNSLQGTWVEVKHLWFFMHDAVAVEPVISQRCTTAIKHRVYVSTI